MLRWELSALLAVLFALSPASALAQRRPYFTDVDSYVVRGQTLVWARQTLDAVRALEPDADIDDLSLDLTTAGDYGVIDVRYRLPAPPGTISTAARRYRAETSAGRVGAPQTAERFRAARAFPRVPDSQISNVSIEAEDLLYVELALDALNARFHADLRLSDTQVFYTLQQRRAFDPDHRITTDYRQAAIVFLPSGQPLSGYSVLIENGVADVVVEGVVDAGSMSSNWFAPEALQ